MESVRQPTPADSPPVDSAVIEGRERAGRRWHTPPVGSPVRLRLDLQRRARYNLRRHVQRSGTRFAVLVFADVGSFAVTRALIRAIRDAEVVGSSIARVAATITPAGILNGWQYASALLVSLILLGCYRAGDRRRDPRRLFLAAALATGLPLWMSIWIRGPSVVAVEYAITTILVWAGVFAERSLVDRIVQWVRPAEDSAARTLFVGTAADCAQVSAMPAFQSQADYRSVGFVDIHVPPAPQARGHFVELARVIHESGAEAVVVCGQLSAGQLVDVTSAAHAAECQLLTLPCAVGVPGVEPSIVWRRGQALMQLTAPTLKGWQLALKRAMDIVCAVFGLLFVAPLMFVVAVAIKVGSPGPVFFAHDRLGLNGRRFKCFKFRSMRPDADSVLRSNLELWRKYVTNNYKLCSAEDPRLTRVGRFLRRTSIDELPQLINVLRGEMSFVGPRPIVPEELEQYGHGAAVFLSLKPGITGAWQVNGRSHMGYPERVDCELEYVRRWTLGLDLWIILRTAPALLTRRGAY